MQTAAPSDRSLSRARLSASVISAVFATVLISGWAIFEFDMALVCYGVATVLSTYAFVVRFSLWYQRPATNSYYRRAFEHLRQVKQWPHLMPALIKRVTAYFGGNAFVAKRGLLRWFAHWPIMLGCVMAASIAFPLVFGWVWFTSVPENLNNYQLMVFHIPLMQFATDSFFAFMLFHGLVWASFPVLLGVGVAFVRRLRNRGDLATQNMADDFMPLIALFVLSVTGLLLAVSYTWLSGAAHDTIAWLHAGVVIVTILWLPYSKFMHVPQRSLKVAEMITSICDTEMACCKRCEQAFASRAQIEDLKRVEAQLGFNYTDGEEHYQDVCPRCRRANLVLAQGQRWRAVSSATAFRWKR